LKYWFKFIYVQEVTGHYGFSYQGIGFRQIKEFLNTLFLGACVISLSGDKQMAIHDRDQA